VIVHDAEPDQPGDAAAPLEPGWSVAAEVAEIASAAATSMGRGMANTLAETAGRSPYRSYTRVGVSAAIR